MTIRNEWILQSQFGEEKKVINAIKRMLASSDAYRHRVEDMMTAVAEACLNAFEHGNQLDPHLQVRVQMECDAKGITFRIYDEGNGFTYPNTSMRTIGLQNLEEINDRGWGVFLISNLANEIKIGHEHNKFFFEIQFVNEGGDIVHAGK